jgi:hypothetical protein
MASSLVGALVGTALAVPATRRFEHHLTVRRKT